MGATHDETTQGREPCLSALPRPGKSRCQNSFAAAFRLRPDTSYFIPKDCDVGRSIVEVS